MKPTKTIITRSPQQAVGAIPLEWLQPDSIHYQQKFERGAVYILALVPGIKRIVHQPLQVELGLPERTIYTPDFGLEFHTGETVIVEVKPRRFIKEHQAIFDAAAKLLKRQGKSFHVLYEEQLSPMRLRTAEHFVFLAKRQVTVDQLEQLVTFVEAQGKVTFGSIEKAGHSLDVLGHAIGRRLLCMEPTLARKASSWVSTPKHCAGTHAPSYWLQANPWGEDEVTLPPIAAFPLVTDKFLPKNKPARFF